MHGEWQEESWGTAKKSCLAIVGLKNASGIIYLITARLEIQLLCFCCNLNSGKKVSHVRLTFTQYAN